MRITGISTHVVGTPWRNPAYVRVHTEEGLTGVGETRMLGHTDALVGYLREAEANHIAGSDPFAAEDLVRRTKYGGYGRAGEIVMSGIARVEMACWDIKGKALGVPVWQLLGGRVTDRVKAYANGWYTVERTPQAFHEAALKVVGRGYRALKLDPSGTGHFELDHAETLRSVALLEPAAVAAAVLAGGPRPGERIAVVGAGTLGLLAVQLLAAVSPAELLVADPRTERAEQALPMGATGMCDPAGTGGLRGRYDLVVETAGAPTTAHDSCLLARRGGRVALTGLPGPGARGIDPVRLSVSRLTVRSVFGAPPAAWAHAVRAFGAGLLTPAPLITHELPLEDFAAAVALVGGGDPGVGKVILRP